jgi:hypothetical protein
MSGSWGEAAVPAVAGILEIASAGVPAILPSSRTDREGGHKLIAAAFS